MREMKTRWWLVIVVLAFGLGWLSRRPTPEAPSKETTAKAERGLGAASAGATPRETSRERWAERLREDDIDGVSALAGQIPAKDRGAAIELWLTSFGIGGLDNTAVTRFRTVIDAWVAQDPAAALQWASSLRDPGMRELGMVSVAGSLATSDPQQAFDCLVAHGEFRHGIGDGRIMDLMKNLSRDAAAQGPDAIAAIWAKFPKAGESVNSFSGVALELDPATDFRALNEALRSQMGDPLSRPIYPAKLMETWARQDPAAARAYLIDLAGTKGRFSDEWSEVYGVISKARGSAAAQQWALELLRELPEGDRGALFLGVDYANSPGRIHELLRNATEDEAAAWINETLQASADREKTWQIKNVLRDLPVEEQIQHLKTLRGPQALPSANAAMAELQLSAGQQEEVRKAINGS